MCPVGRIGQLAVAGQLVGFLAVLTAALAVALAGDRAVTGVRLAGQAEGQGQVDVGLGHLGATAVLFGPPGGEDHRARRGGQGLDGLPQLPDADPGDPLDPVGPVGGGAGLDRAEPGGPLGDVVEVDQVVLDGQVQQPVGQGQVGARHRGEVTGRALGGCGVPGVDDDMGGPGGPSGVEPLHGRRHGGGRVGADQQDGLRLGEVAEGERQAAVDAEGSVARRCGGRHAEPAVVVDHRRPQRDPGELAERVRLLVRQSPAAEAADGVAAVALLGRDQPVGNQVESLVPRCRPELTGPVTGHRTDQRGEQPLRVVEQAGCGPALRAQPTTISREIDLRLEHGRALSTPGDDPPGTPREGSGPATRLIPHCSEQ